MAWQYTPAARSCPFSARYHPLNLKNLNTTSVTNTSALGYELLKIGLPYSAIYMHNNQNDTWENLILYNIARNHPYKPTTKIVFNTHTWIYDMPIMASIAM